jgi:hypothetical protein
MDSSASLTFDPWQLPLGGVPSDFPALPDPPRLPPPPVHVAPSSSSPPPPPWSPVGSDGPAPPERSDRGGAIWVTATGALLLFAAAATFVAVRWDHLADWQKFGALVVVTQLFLVGGWLGRRRVPATAAALFSLGAVLVSLDAWSAAATGPSSWHRGLFVGGLLGVVCIPVARRVFDTVALRWAWVVTVPLGCAGAAAFAGLAPPAVTVAALGLAALQFGRRREALSWLALGATAPIAALCDPFLPIGHGVLVDLRIVGPWVPWCTAATAALLIAAVIRDGRAHDRTSFLAVGAALAVIDVAVALADGGVRAGGWWLSAAALFVGLEAAASVTIRDHFWAPLLRPVVFTTEIVAAEAVIVLACMRFGPATRSPFVLPSVRPMVASLAACTFLVGWLVADDRIGRGTGRRHRVRDLLRGQSSLATSCTATLLAAFAVASLPIDRPLLRVGLVVTGALALVGRRGGGTVAGSLVILASLVPLGLSAADIAVTALALAALAAGSRRQTTAPAAMLISAAAACSLALWSAELAVDTVRMAHFAGPSFTWVDLVMLGTVLVGLALGSVAATRSAPLAGILPWAVSGLAVVRSFGEGTTRPVTLALSAIAVTWWIVDAAFRHDVIPAAIAAAASPAVTAAFLLELGLVAPEVGIGLAFASVTLVGFALVVAERGRRVLFAAAVAQILAGLGFASGSPGATGIVITIAGLLLVVTAVLEQQAVLAYNGSGLALLGSWQALFGYHVVTPEAYLAPLALVLTAAGMHARSTRQVSSWAAFVPAIGVLGGGAFALRLAGDPGWHAVVAGAVAVAAVAAGAWRRLAGPLLVGSALLMAITLNETIRVTAGVPTWIWLAIGGSALLGTGVTMELRGLGPIESGRRIAELVVERFE